jgi:hypothetical protein
LGRTQPRGRQIPIVELGDVAGGLAHGEAVAIGRIWKRSRGHGQPLGGTPCTRCHRHPAEFVCNFAQRPQPTAETPDDSPTAWTERALCC